jgi:hypothetical protein
MSLQMARSAGCSATWGGSPAAADGLRTAIGKSVESMIGAGMFNFSSKAVVGGGFA